MTDLVRKALVLKLCATGTTKGNSSDVPHHPSEALLFLEQKSYLLNQSFFTGVLIFRTPAMTLQLEHFGDCTVINRQKSAITIRQRKFEMETSLLKNNYDRKRKDIHIDVNVYFDGDVDIRLRRSPMRPKNCNWIVLIFSASLFIFCILQFREISNVHKVLRNSSNAYALAFNSAHDHLYSKVFGDVGGEGSAFCLLIKDDNDILSEWIAYHYHVFRMRRLIIAVDPDSKTSPDDVTKLWENFDLNVTLLNDADYTPDYFHKKQYEQMPNSVQKEVILVNSSFPKDSAAHINEPILRTQWHRNETYVRDHQEEVRQDVHRINNHRFRQKNFVSECYRIIREENQSFPISWTVHIDTDEFLVPNPWITSFIHQKQRNNGIPFVDSKTTEIFQTKDLKAMFPNTPSSGSLWSFFQDFREFRKNQDTCVMMPRPLFGAREDGDTGSTTARKTSNRNGTNVTTTTWNHKNFESLRWMYHSNFNKSTRAKSIVDVKALSSWDRILSLKLAKSVHRPLHYCPGEPSRIENKRQYDQPLAVYHYLGSKERYLHRGDARRNATMYEIYDEGSSYAKGDGNDPNDRTPLWWIGGWLDSFVETHGSDKAYAVLGESYAKRHQA